MRYLQLTDVMSAGSFIQEVVNSTHPKNKEFGHNHVSLRDVEREYPLMNLLTNYEHVDYL